MEIKHEPGKLDLAFEQALEAHKAVDNIMSKKYLIFRPYIDPMTLRPHKSADKGYYFKLVISRLGDIFVRRNADNIFVGADL